MIATRPHEIGNALQGDVRAVRALVDRLTPVIQRRVARTLLRSGAGARRGNVRQEVEDLVQDVFRELFADDGAVLQSWDAGRGASLEGFIALVAERHVLSVLRSRRRSPFTEDPVEAQVMEYQGPRSTPAQAEHAMVTRDTMRYVYQGLRERLSPQGFAVFVALFCDELGTEAACAKLGLSADALYAWRSRIRKLARSLISEQAGVTP